MNTTNKFYYDLCEKDIYTSWVPAILVYFCGVVGNFIALILLWINRNEHKWKSFYKLYTGLAITDFLGIFLVYPFVAARYASVFTWCYPKPVCQFVSFIFVDAHISGALLICAMSLDRYINLVCPQRLNARSEGLRYTLILCGIWFGASVFSLLHLVGVGDSQLFYPGSWCYFNFVGHDLGNQVMSFMYSILGAIIILVTLVSNTLTIWRTCRDPVEVGILLDARSVSGYYESHVVMFIVTISVLFFVLWTPLLVDVFLHAIEVQTNNESLELWFVRMTVLNAIVDPWIYIVLRRDSLRKIGEMFQRCSTCCSGNTNRDESERESLIDNRIREEPNNTGY